MIILGVLNMRLSGLVVLLLALPGISLAQGSNRARTWEFSIGGLYQDSESASGTGGSSFDMDSALGLGFNIGYNLTTKFALGADFDFLEPDYTATLADENDPSNTLTVRHSLSQFNGRFKATLHFMEGPFSPFVEVGAGWTYFDSNVADGPPQTGCYWHPYWGYICANYYDTISETELTYGGAVGFRFDFAGGSFVKANYSIYEVDVSGAGADPQLATARVEYGWRF
jgi:opacity protein-like surface antigen